MDEKVTQCDRHPFVNPSPSSSPWHRVVSGNIPECFSAPLAAGRLPVEGEQKGQVPLREPGSPCSPPLQARYRKVISLGMMKPKWKRLLCFCTKGSNLLTRTSALDNWISNKQTVFEPLHNLGSFIIAIQLPKSIHLFTIKQEGPTFGSSVCFHDDNSLYVVKMTALNIQ